MALDSKNGTDLEIMRPILVIDEVVKRLVSAVFCTRYSTLEPSRMLSVWHDDSINVR